MRVTLAFLARSGQANQDGTISALAAGIHSIGFTAFPAQWPQLSLACELQFEAAEVGSEQTIEVRAIGPSGRPVMPLMGMAIIPNVVDDAQPGPAFFPFVYDMHNIRFELPGQYHFIISSRGTTLHSVDLFLQQVPAQPSTDASVRTLAGALQAGFAAFMQGNRDEAMRTFEGLIERFPDSPEAHNNLGFVLLSYGRSREALPSFQAAMEHGAPNVEIVEANIATCHCLLQDYTIASAEFTRLLSRPLTAIGCVLIALGRSSYSLVNIRSSADFLALMALNGGRSFVSAGNMTEGLRLGQIAQAGLLTMETDTRSIFEPLLAELLADAQPEAR
jgi:hypothetical protein